MIENLISQDHKRFNPKGQSSIKICVEDGINETAQIVPYESGRGLALKLSMGFAPLDWTIDEVFAFVERKNGRWLLVFLENGNGFCIDESGRQHPMTWN